MWHRSSNSSIDNIIKIPLVSVYHAYNSDNTLGSSASSSFLYVGDRTKFKCGVVTKTGGSILKASLYGGVNLGTYSEIIPNLVSNTEYDISAYKYIGVRVEAGYQNAATVKVENMEIS